jgi:C1A family cysteine protease
MRTFAAFAIAAVASAIDQQTYEYMRYIAAHGKNYETLAEFQMRQELFSVADAAIKEWNADESNTSRMGHNFLSDWTEAEKAAIRGLDMDIALVDESDVMVHTAPEGFEAVSTYNWCDTQNTATTNMCSPIKNQGACGSCWAFSATETVESAVSIFHGVQPVLVLSPQQLVSCSQSYGNAGCGGGWYYYAWNYLSANAQETEADYPYSNATFTFGVTGTCTANTSLGVVKTQSGSNTYVKVGHTNSDMMSAIMRQPTSVAIDAASNTFQYYTSGVITSGCGISIDHAVVAVGYGTENNQDYFLVRNSWGTGWGDQGFVKIAQSSSNGSPGVCAINEMPYYPNVIYPL